MAKKLFQNGTVISWDETTESVKVLHGASLLVNDDKIAAIGKNIEPPADAEIIDIGGKILTPGFINTHCHMWQTAMRSLAPNATLAEYFTSYSQFSPVIKSYTAEDVYLSCLEGYIEGLNGGVTTFVEHCHCSWDLEVVKKAYEGTVDSGARIYWCSSVEGRDGCSVEDHTNYMREIEGRGQDRLVSLGLAWDALGSAEPEDVARMKELMQQVNMKAVTLHQLGGPWPVGNNGPVKGTEQGLQDTGIPVIFSHCGLGTNDEWDAVRQHNWNVSITPESEFLYGHGNQSSRFVLDHASLGVDTNFTMSGDILTQARLFLQSVRNDSYNKTLNSGKIPRRNPMTVEDAFLLVTRQGGKALRRDDLGVLQVGAQADLVCFGGDSPNMLGWTDPIAAVILHANVGDIEHVIVGGEFRKRDGKLVLKEGEWADISARFASLARRIQSEHPGPQPGGDKFFGVGEWGDVEVMSTKRKQ